MGKKRRERRVEHRVHGDDCAQQDDETAHEGDASKRVCTPSSCCSARTELTSGVSRRLFRPKKPKTRPPQHASVPPARRARGEPLRHRAFKEVSAWTTDECCCRWPWPCSFWAGRFPASQPRPPPIAQSRSAARWPARHRG